MELSTAQEIIVIILASALAIFLVLSIIAAIMVIRLLKTLRVMVDKAEGVVESVEAVGDVLRMATRQISIFSFIQGIIGRYKRGDDK